MGQSRHHVQSGLTLYTEWMDTLGLLGMTVRKRLVKSQWQEMVWVVTLRSEL